jgi:hypothetical protein
MPDVHTEINFDNLSPAEIEAKRVELVIKGNGDWQNLNADDLHVLAMLTATLRRRSAKPPKAPKEKSARQKVDLATVLGQIPGMEGS